MCSTVCFAEKISDEIQPINKAEKGAMKKAIIKKVIAKKTETKKEAKVDLTQIIKGLSSTKAKIRKLAKKSALALPPKARKELAKILLASKDPELEMTGKELAATIKERKKVVTGQRDEYGPLSPFMSIEERNGILLRRSLKDKGWNWK